MHAERKDNVGYIYIIFILDIYIYNFLRSTKIKRLEMVSNLIWLVKFMQEVGFQHTLQTLFLFSQHTVINKSSAFSFAKSTRVNTHRKNKRHTARKKKRTVSMYLVLFEDSLLMTSKTDRQRVKRASKSKMINGCLCIISYVCVADNFDRKSRRWRL